MKKLILSLLFLQYTITNFAQLQEKLFQEFCEFVETQNKEALSLQHKKPVLFLPFEKPGVAHKTSKKNQVLDSIVFDNLSTGRKEVDIFEYDNRGRQIKAAKIAYHKDTLSSTEELNFEYKKNNLTEINYIIKHERIKIRYPKSKASYFYEKNKLIESRFFTFENNKWHLLKKVKHEYDNKNQLAKTTRLSVDSVGIETANYNIDYKYEGNAIVVKESFQDTVKYTFNNAGQLLNSFSMGFNPMQMQFRKSIEYNKNWDKTEERYLRWATIDSVNLNLKIDAFYNYDTYNKLIERKKFQHGSHGGYKFSEKTNTTYTYDEYGFPAVFIQKRKDEYTGSYENYIKKEYDYDEYGNLHDETTYYWERFYKIWEEQFSKSNTFNLEFKIWNILLPKYFVPERDWVFDQFEQEFTENYEYDPAKPESEDYDKITSIFQNFTHMKTSLNETFWGTSYTKTYHYSERKLNFTSKTQPYIGAYPNPASQFFTIDVATLPINTKIKMYSLNGEKVMEKPIPAYNEKIFINHLPSGLYYFNILVDDIAIECTGKLMVK